MGNVLIGISGWRYEPWRGVFYPKGLAQHRELEFASRALPTIELNGSFYSLQHPDSYRKWYDATPPGFIFSVKANRYLTHFLRLNRIEKPLANLLASGVFNLRDKLGPMLWQFPENFRYRSDVVEHFLSKWLYREDVTADFMYLRLHGEEELYASGYTDASLERWAARIRAWSEGGEPADAQQISAEPPPPRASRDVYCYFDNDIKVHAPFDARTLIDKLGLTGELARVSWQGSPRRVAPQPYRIFKPSRPA